MPFAVPTSFKKCPTRSTENRSTEVTVVLIKFQKFLGHYNFKSKTHEDKFNPEGLCKAAMFALLVNEELDSWPEQSTRERRWLSVPEAAELCRHSWMKDALENGFAEWYSKKDIMNSGEEDGQPPTSEPSSPEHK